MIPEHYRKMLGQKSAIREIFAYGMERAKVIGPENVFDYSLGNPSVAPPEQFTQAMLDLLQTSDPLTLHGYSPSLGIESVRQAIADSLRRRFGIAYEARHIFPTTGAAGAVAHALRAVGRPGDRVLTFAPFFPEYRPYVEGAGLRLEVVPAHVEDFQIQFDELEKRLAPDVAAVLINTPNNPSGVVYTEATLRRLAALLEEKQREWGQPIYLISDEPYREIVFSDEPAPYPAALYPNTLTCYSFSKSLSLPGERIGYVAAGPDCAEAETIIEICGQISRGTGHNCPPSIIQLAVARCLDVTSDLRVYRTNRDILYKELTDLGFTCVEPGGTFYIFPKALEADAGAFCKKALQYDLLLVPGDSFGCPGYFRMAYCIDTDKVLRSLPALRKLAAEYR